jgi:small subunit ribosomal protein S4
MAFTAKDAKVMQKRSTPPGQHGQGRNRPSEFGLQLREKQKAKINYGVLEKQFRRIFSKAQGQAGVTGDNLLKLLELRLDNVVYRLGFAETRAQSRQLVNHGFFEVNGKRVDVPSFTLRPGDVVKVKETKQKSKYMASMKEKLAHAKTQEWLELVAKDLSGKILSAPTPEQIDNQINTQLIVEHYSRI